MRAAGFVYEGDRPGGGRLAMEALILAGGKAERLGEAAQGKPEAARALRREAARATRSHRSRAAGVTRAIVACAAGQEAHSTTALGGLGVDIVAVGEPEPLGRGGGLRFAAGHGASRAPCWP